MLPKLLPTAERVEDFKLGSGFLVLKNAKGELLAVGDNRQGQCGFSEDLDQNYLEVPSLIQFPVQNVEVNQLTCGFQFTLVLDRKHRSAGTRTLWGFGKKSWNQFLPFGVDPENLSKRSAD